MVVGGGFIGSEVAAALRMQGCEVAMLIPEAGVGARVFPADLSGFLADYYREKGVEVRTGEGVTGVEDRAGKAGLRTTLGKELAADVVVAGLGIQPSVELAERAGLKVDNGIVVDAHCRSSHPSIYAAGDVANFHNPALDARMRVEHEDNANTMGKVAGENMAGQATPYDHLPFFYSDLFDLGYEAVGDLDARLETFSDWKVPFREGVVYYLKGWPSARSPAVEHVGTGGRCAGPDRTAGSVQSWGLERPVLEPKPHRQIVMIVGELSCAIGRREPAVRESDHQRRLR